MAGRGQRWTSCCWRPWKSLSLRWRAAAGNSEEERRSAMAGTCAWEGCNKFQQWGKNSQHHGSTGNEGAAALCALELGEGGVHGKVLGVTTERGAGRWSRSCSMRL
ncbi:hypothetical protein Zm00014a_038933 [Zea mays]|uniref:Uncharacterized protein n=1 Tax=Zea mays TaxID=4577 RepID=A0A3L6EZ65_MAIZE|nr:hypothetical protein Zm00014a_038933 [Zea mays]